MTAPRHPEDRPPAVSGASLNMLGIIALTAIGVGGLIAVEHLGIAGYNTAIVGQIITLVTPTIAVFVSIHRSNINSRKLDHLHDCAHSVDQKASEAVAVAKETKRDVLDAVNAQTPPFTGDATIHAGKQS